MGTVWITKSERVLQHALARSRALLLSGNTKSGTLQSESSHQRLKLCDLLKVCLYHLIQMCKPNWRMLTSADLSHKSLCCHSPPLLCMIAKAEHRKRNACCIIRTQVGNDTLPFPQNVHLLEAGEIHT